MANFISEDAIERAAVQLLTAHYGYRSLNCETADAADLNDRSGRDSKQQVVLPGILFDCTVKLNPTVPEQQIREAVARFTARRNVMSPLLANKEVYTLLRDGVPVEYEDGQGVLHHEQVRLIDFNRPQANDFLAVTQLWIKGEHRFRRPDLLLYINGIPLVFFEFKNSNVKLQQAYNDNLTNYRSDIPQLFDSNGFCVLSNAVETRVGSFTAGYEHFFHWLRPDDEREKVNSRQIATDGGSLERLLHGLFPKERLLDYLENFVLYYNNNSKIIAQNHQYLGVNNAVASFRNRQERQGKLGVFWHTQGSGKSFSMIFLARKVFRKFQGNFTFAVITDREDLDGQIYRNFLNTETVTENETARPRNSKEMQQYFGRNLRLIFTLIQKFRYDKYKQYPVLSERDDIIVIVDEAHRTQYASLAENMRKGLPNAQYFAFTGTPILGSGEQIYHGKTWDWFGDYVSQYNFVQSIDDGATVPLYYQKRVPEVLLQNDNLSEEFYQILEEEDLDTKSREKLEREYATELQLIKRDDRLDRIAEDIMQHFPERGYLGKGMVISVDKYTCVKMYDKVQHFWKKEIQRLVGEAGRTSDDMLKKKLQDKLHYMRAVEMAVVISEENGEEEKFSKQGLDIRPHRQKLKQVDENGHDIEYRFKDPTDKLQLVFVCAMWLTGFDAPTVSTLYLDKPMKDHTLMQTIARANRVTSCTINGVPKTNGEIVDYYNVFRNMKKALNDYAQGGAGKENAPVEEKEKLFELLDEAITATEQFCARYGIRLQDALQETSTLGKIQLFENWADTLLAQDVRWKEFKVFENSVNALYEACKPEIVQREFRPLLPVIRYLRGVIDAIIRQADVEKVKARIEDLLDQSIVTPDEAFKTSGTKAGYFIDKKAQQINLRDMNFSKLSEEFKRNQHKHIEITNLRMLLEEKLEKMLRENTTRTDFARKLQELIDNYNAGIEDQSDDNPANQPGSGNDTAADDLFEKLLAFAKSLLEEEERHIREGLTADELELFDVLKKEEMTADEKEKVKAAAKHLLHRLQEEQPKVLVQDWYKDSQSQTKVHTAIGNVLDQDLPDTYDKTLFQEKWERIYNLIYDYACRGMKWAV